MMKRLLFGLLFGFAASLCGAQTVLHFVQKYGYAMIDGEVNGKPGWFLLDTGTPLDFIFNSEYVPVGSNRQIGTGRLASGQKFYLCRGDSTVDFTVDGVKLSGIETYNGSLHFMEEITNTPSFLGFIGYGYLSRSRFVLDYREGTCTLYPLDSVPDIDTGRHPLLATINFSCDERRPQMPVTGGSVGGVPVRITFDTGASSGWIRLDRQSDVALRQARSLSADMWGTYKLKHLFVGSLDAPTLKGLHLNPASDGGNEIILSGEFLKHYITVWDYSRHTIEIYRNSSSWLDLF